MSRLGVTAVYAAPAPATCGRAAAADTAAATGTTGMNATSNAVIPSRDQKIRRPVLCLVIGSADVKPTVPDDSLNEFMDALLQILG